MVQLSKCLKRNIGEPEWFDKDVYILLFFRYKGSVMEQ